MNNSLHRQFLELASQKHRIEYKLLALLPEIYESGIYRNYAHTIQGYAYRFAQLSSSVVEKRLKLEAKIQAKPVLQKLVSEVDVHKVAMLATIINNENQDVLVEKIQSMSTQSLQELSKELRGKVPDKISLNLNVSNTRLWKLLKKKHDGLSDDAILERMLERELLESNEQSCHSINGQRHNFSAQKNTRHISDAVKAKAFAEFGGKCSYWACDDDASVLHHPERFSVIGNHNNIKPLCKVHHEFMHNNLIANETDSVDKWHFQLKKTVNPVDLKYLSYKLQAP